MLAEKGESIKAESLKNEFYTKEEFTRVLLNDLPPYYKLKKMDIDEIFNKKAENQLISKQYVELILDAILKLETNSAESQNLRDSNQSLSDYVEKECSFMLTPNYHPHGSHNKRMSSISGSNYDVVTYDEGSSVELHFLSESNSLVKASNANQEEISNLRLELKQQKDFLRALESDNEALCNIIYNWNLNVQGLENEKLKSKTNINADMQAKLAETKNEIVRLERKVRETEDEKKKEHEEGRNWKNKYQVLRENYKEVQGLLQNRSIKLSLTNNNDAKGSTTSEHSEQIELLKIELNILRAKNKDLEEEKEGFQKIIDESKDQLNNAKEFNDTLKLEKNDLKSRLEKLEKELSALQSDNAVKTSILMQSFRAESLVRESLPKENYAASRLSSRAQILFDKSNEAEGDNDIPMMESLDSGSCMKKSQQERLNEGSTNIREFMRDVFDNKAKLYEDLQTSLAEKYNEMVEMERIIREMEERTEQALKQLNNNHEENQNLLRSTIEMQKQGIKNIMGQLKVQRSYVKELGESLKLDRNNLQRLSGSRIFYQKSNIIPTQVTLKGQSSYNDIPVTESIDFTQLPKPNTVSTQVQLKGRISYNDIPVTESQEVKLPSMDSCITQKFQDPLSSSKCISSEDRYSELRQFTLETINEEPEETVKKQTPLEYSAFTPIKHPLKKSKSNVEEEEGKYLSPPNLTSCKSSGKNTDMEEDYSGSKQKWYEESTETSPNNTLEQDKSRTEKKELGNIKKILDLEVQPKMSVNLRQTGELYRKSKDSLADAKHFLFKLTGTNLEYFLTSTTPYPYISLIGLNVIDNDERENDKFIFRLRNPKNNSEIILATSSDFEKREWVKALKEAQKTANLN